MAHVRTSDTDLRIELVSVYQHLVDCTRIVDAAMQRMRRAGVVATEDCRAPDHGGVQRDPLPANMPSPASTVRTQ